MLTVCPATGGGMPGPGSVLRPRTELWTGPGPSSLVAATRKAYWVSGVRPAMLAVSPFWVTAAAIVFAGVWVALCGEAAGQYSNQASAGRLRGLTLALRTAVLEVIPWGASAPTIGVPTTSSEVVCEGSSVTPLLAVTVKLKLPAVVGEPDSSPSALRWRPPGRFPPVTLNCGPGDWVVVWKA